MTILDQHFAVTNQTSSSRHDDWLYAFASQCSLSNRKLMSDRGGQFNLQADFRDSRSSLILLWISPFKSSIQTASFLGSVSRAIRLTSSIISLRSAGVIVVDRCVSTDNVHRNIFRLIARDQVPSSRGTMAIIFFAARVGSSHRQPVQNYFFFCRRTQHNSEWIVACQAGSGRAPAMPSRYWHSKTRADHLRNRTEGEVARANYLGDFRAASYFPVQNACSKKRFKAR